MIGNSSAPAWPPKIALDVGRFKRSPLIQAFVVCPTSTNAFDLSADADRYRGPATKPTGPIGITCLLQISHKRPDNPVVSMNIQFRKLDKIPLTLLKHQTAYPQVWYFDTIAHVSSCHLCLPFLGTVSERHSVPPYPPNQSYTHRSISNELQIPNLVICLPCMPCSQTKSLEP
jgi:hypothetical protein